MKIVRAIFRSARRDGYLFQDPAEGVNLIKNRDPFVRRPFTLDELRAVIEVADPEWQSLIKFGLYTGQRLGDIALLTWSQIDVERDEIRLRQRKTGKLLLIPIATPLHEHLLGLAAGDNARARCTHAGPPLSPRRREKSLRSLTSSATYLPQRGCALIASTKAQERDARASVQA